MPYFYTIVPFEKQWAAFDESFVLAVLQELKLRINFDDDP